MSHSCCSMQGNLKVSCPQCKNQCGGVSYKTILHHIKNSWGFKASSGSYYFCDNPSCDVVYFSDSASLYTTSDVKTDVGIKRNSDESILCYCFNITKADYLNNKTIKDFVFEQTKNNACSCDTSNPSGKCCLKYFK